MPFLPSLTDGALLRPTDVAFISSTYAAHGGGSHTYTHIARTYNILREGRDRFWLAASRILLFLAAAAAFRHLMSRPQYAIKTPRMRRPPDSKYPTNVLPILRNTNLKKLRWQTFHCMVAAFVHQTKFFFFHSGMPFSQWRIRLRLASSSFPVPYILSNSYLEE